MVGMCAWKPLKLPPAFLLLEITSGLFRLGLTLLLVGSDTDHHCTWCVRADHITKLLWKKEKCCGFFYIEMISYHKNFIGVKIVEFKL